MNVIRRCTRETMRVARTRSTRNALCVLALALSPLRIAQAHHSSLGLFDVNRIIEIEGVVTSIYWSNPHPRYTVAVTNEDGTEVEWNIEIGGAVSTLRLRGVTRDVVDVGDRVRIAGEASMRNLPELFAHNLLLESGQEVLLGVRAKPRWPAGMAGDLFRTAPDEALVADARARAHGIFRVWSIDLADRMANRLYRRPSYPLTAAAAALKAQWDPRNSPYIGCQSRGMPYLMHQAYPLEFVSHGDDILLRMEFYDAERLIHMDAGQPPAATPYSLYGYSAGHWQGGTLVVETTHIDVPYFDGSDGTPQSRAIHLLERFTVNAAEDRLDYTLIVNDPETFTEEMEFRTYYIWRPEIRVEPFNCRE